MTPFFTPEQRDALYDQILDRLSGIGDIELAVRAGRYDSASRLCEEYSDELRLLRNDLGFGESSGQRIWVTTAPEVLQRVLPRLRKAAEGFTASQEPEWAAVREMRDRSRLVAEACTNVLDELGDAADPTAKARGQP
jgi:hypothetical protein